MKQDRYVARTASGDIGELVTPPLLLNARTLLVNANAEGGRLRVELRDENGAPIQGFTRDDSTIIAGDKVDHPITWGKPVSALRDRPVRLAFLLENASLFAFYLQEE